MTDTRIRYLDGLRGVLAVIVFVHHFLYAFYPDLIFGGEYRLLFNGKLSFEKFIAFSPINIFFNPGAAIHFFFFLSGYVQSYHYLKNPDLIILQKSFIKRYFRLAIPTLAVLLLVFFFHKLHLIRRELIPHYASTADWTKSLMPDNLGFLALLKHGLVECYFNNSKYYQILWTMPIELFNSWMTLILLFITHKLKNKVVLWGFWIVVQLFFTQSYYSVAFTIGLTLCHFQLNVPGFSSFFSKALVKLFCVVTGIYFASYPYIGYENSTNQGFYAPISFFEKYPHLISYLFGDFLLFCYLLNSNRPKNFLSKKIFLFLGNISFMLYLVHLLVLFSFSPLLYRALFNVAGFQANMVITGTATLIVTAFVSWLLYTFVDKPVLSICNGWIKKLFGI